MNEEETRPRRGRSLVTKEGGDDHYNVCILVHTRVHRHKVTPTFNIGYYTYKIT